MITYTQYAWDNPKSVNLIYQNVLIIYQEESYIWEYGEWWNVIEFLLSVYCDLGVTD